jgi:hypothetical protein
VSLITALKLGGSSGMMIVMLLGAPAAGVPVGTMAVDPVTVLTGVTVCGLPQFTKPAVNMTNRLIWASVLVVLFLDMVSSVILFN